LDSLSRQEIEGTVRSHHPEKTLATLPTRPEVSNEMLAPFFGTDIGTYKEIKATLTQRARRCAHELLEDAQFAVPSLMSPVKDHRFHPVSPL
jgi:hypothetical protein